MNSLTEIINRAMSPPVVSPELVEVIEKVVRDIDASPYDTLISFGFVFYHPEGMTDEIKSFFASAKWAYVPYFPGMAAVHIDHRVSGLRRIGLELQGIRLQLVTANLVTRMVRAVKEKVLDHQLAIFASYSSATTLAPTYMTTFAAEEWQLPFYRAAFPSRKFAIVEVPELGACVSIT